jgi:GNAT superfamily N-acetyltransferase
VWTREPDDWLAGVFGYPVFRLCVPEQGTNGAAESVPLARLGEEREAFYYAKVAASHVAGVQALTAAGFHPVDMNLTLEQEATGARQGGLLEELGVRAVRDEDGTHLLDIAGSCFVYSRFHLDPLVPAATADAVKREWVRSYLQGRRGEAMLVAETAGRPAGFLAVLAARSGGKTVRVIDLVGVGKEHQGRGIGRRLVEAFRRVYAGRCELLRVGTQAANMPSLRLYQRCGFQLAGAAWVLHAHVKEGRVVR